MKTAWHWGGNSSLVNDPLENQSATHCMLAFRTRGSLWTPTVCFTVYFVAELLNWELLIDMNE